MYDVAVIGAGVAGMATAARLQARGLSTVVLEARGQPGGCEGGGKDGWQGQPQ
jgi:phytoene dehydrogenase-like protein